MSRETSVIIPETIVPDGEATATTHPYCGRPFHRERLRDLHVGNAHEDLSDGETAVYEAAVEAKVEDLFVYRLKVADTLDVVFTALFLLAVVGFSL